MKKPNNYTPPKIRARIIATPKPRRRVRVRRLSFEERHSEENGWLSLGDGGFMKEAILPT